MSIFTKIYNRIVGKKVSFRKEEDFTLCHLFAENFVIDFPHMSYVGELDEIMDKVMSDPSINKAVRIEITNTISNMKNK